MSESRRVDDAYFDLHEVALPSGRRVTSKLGVRGFPEPPPGADLLADVGDAAIETARALGARAVDASGTAGAAWAGRQGHGDAAGPTDVAEVLDPSAAAVRCARVTHPDARVDAGLPWDVGRNERGPVGSVLVAPPGDRGTARVEAEIEGAAAGLAPDGVAWILLHKDRGAKRYAKTVAARFGASDIVERRRGWRLLRASRPRASRGVGDGAASDEAPWIPAEVDLPAGRVRLDALPGVHAAGRLDPGTRALLATADLDGLAGAHVLDLGCGSGALAVAAVLAAARSVCAVDDDLAAVRSARRNLAAIDREGSRTRVVHSDLDAALEPAGSTEAFDVVLCNPPFHVGAAVRLELSRAFVRAAARRLAPGGTLWLVANAQLPYEAEFEAWRSLEVRPAGRFKVLRATR